MPGGNNAPPYPIKRLNPGDPKLSASNMNRAIDWINSVQFPQYSGQPVLVQTCKDENGDYPNHVDNPRLYPFRFISLEFPSGQTGKLYVSSFPQTSVPDGTFVNLGPSNPEFALPYRPEGALVWVWFSNGYFWAMEPELHDAIFKTPTNGVPPYNGTFLGSAVCEMVRINTSNQFELLVPPDGTGFVTATVFNRSYVHIKKPYFRASREFASGRWVAVHEDEGLVHAMTPEGGIPGRIGLTLQKTSCVIYEPSLNGTLTASAVSEDVFNPVSADILGNRLIAAKHNKIGQLIAIVEDCDTAT